MRVAVVWIVFTAVAGFFSVDEDEDLSLLQIGLVVRSNPVEPPVSTNTEPAVPTVGQTQEPPGREPSSRNVKYGRSRLSDFSNARCDEFVFGECPTIISTSAPRRVEHLRLNLDVHDAGHDPVGYNPSIVRLPERLLGAFPSGKWLTALRTGGEQCPPGVVNFDKKFKEIAVAQDRSERSIEDKYNPVDIDDLDGRAVQALLHSRALHRTWLAILDDNFDVVARTAIRMQNGESFYDDAAVADVRLFPKQSGEIIVGFTAYALQDSPEALPWNDTWWDHETTALLHVESDGAGGLIAYIEKTETRVVVDCPEQQLEAPGPKKNMGFFEKQGTLYALDWIFPTRTGTFRYDPAVANTTETLMGEDHIDKLCYGWEWREGLETDPWQHAKERNPVLPPGGAPKHTGIHNGAHLLWLPEQKVFLGVGHLRRSYSKLMHTSSDYTQQFFTMSSEPPFKLKALTPEFCFASTEDPSACETIQLAFSLLRDGDSLLVGYGLQDCEAKVIFLSLPEVLASLRPVK